MAVYAAHFTRALQGNPTIFQVQAQEALGATVKPALKKVFEYLNDVYPYKFGWCLRWYDELYLVLDCCLQYHYLKHYAASFSESFYGLLRVPTAAHAEFNHGQRLPDILEKGSLICLVFLPYLQEKVERIIQKWREDQEDGKLGNSTSESLRKAAIRVYSIIHLVSVAAKMIQLARYLLGKCESPTLETRMLGLTLREAPEPNEEHYNILPLLCTGRLKNIVLTFPVIGNLMLRSVEYGAFVVQLLRWWDSHGNHHAADLPPPPPPQDSSSTPETVYPGCGSALRSAFKSRGTPIPALDLMMASISQNTLSQYNCTYKLWWQFCQTNDLIPYTGSASDIMLFLTELFKKGVCYGTLNSHRSALSLLLGSNETSDEKIKRLLKGVYKLRPATPKYTCTWDPQLVLDLVAGWVPNRELSLEMISKKLVVLLALCTAHRVQTFALIKLDNIMISSTGVQIGISDVIKTSAAGREQPVLTLPYFNKNKAICPATAIQDYIYVTKDMRSEVTKSLILTFKRPHKPATAQTISRWIKQVLCASDVDVATFSAHSTRHAATSASGLSLDNIRKAAGWTSTSQTFAKFYHRQIIDNGSFARSVFQKHNSL